MNSVIIFSEDIRQFTWCKRTVYLKHVVRARFELTYKMKFGKEAEDKADLPVSRDERLIRKFYVFDDELNVGALIDALVLGNDYAKVIEIKSSRFSKRLDEHHKMQLALQVLLIRRRFPTLRVLSSVYYIEEGVFEEIRLDERHFNNVLSVIDEIRKIITSEVPPEGPFIPAKCSDCEFKPFCVDVWSR